VDRFTTVHLSIVVCCAAIRLLRIVYCHVLIAECYCTHLSWTCTQLALA